MEIKIFIKEFVLFISKTLLLHSFLYFWGLNSPILSILLLVFDLIVFIWRLLRLIP